MGNRAAKCLWPLGMAVVVAAVLLSLNRGPAAGATVGTAFQALTSIRNVPRNLVAFLGYQALTGPLKGRTIGQLMEQYQEQLMGKLAGRFPRFPLLLKFLDAQEMLSVQVHPSDAHKGLLPAGETGKTEAWVVLEAGAESRIYAGLKPGATADDLRRALTNGTVAEDLACFTPKAGDGVFIPAGSAPPP